VIGAQHVGALRHEVHAAKHDEFCVGVTADLLSELVGVAGVIRELDHFVALVVMAEDHETTAELCFGCGDPAVHLLVSQSEILLGQRLPLADMILLVGGQNRQKCGHFERLCETFLKLGTRKSQAPFPVHLELGYLLIITPS
jgi:hypothetical protein